MKYETRNKFQAITNKHKVAAVSLIFDTFNFELVSVFEFRISNLTSQRIVSC